MNIIISCTHYPVASGRYMTDAFRRLGHDVRTLGDSTGNRIPWGGDGWLELGPKYTWHSNGDLTTHWPDWTPDLIVHMDSAFAYHHPVYADVPHVVYGVDNHVRNYRQAGIKRYFLAHKNVSVFEAMVYSADAAHNTGHYDSELGLDAEYLPCGYDPIHFTPSPIAWADREYDVALIGVPYPKRTQAVALLRKSGLKVFAGTGQVYGDYAAIYHNARISLCVSAAGDLAQRVFETAAMGCAILTDPLADLQDAATNKTLGLQGYFVYDQLELLPDIAREILDDTPREEASMAVDDEEVIFQLAGSGMGEFGARQMQECVMVKHTWDARAWRIVQWFKQTYEGLKVNGEKETVEPVDTGSVLSELSGRVGLSDTQPNNGETRVSAIVDSSGGVPRDEPSADSVTGIADRKDEETSAEVSDGVGSTENVGDGSELRPPLAELQPDTAPADTQVGNGAGAEATSPVVATTSEKKPTRKKRGH